MVVTPISVPRATLKATSSTSTSGRREIVDASKRDAFSLARAAATPKRRDIVVSASVDEPWRRPSESGTEKTSGMTNGASGTTKKTKSSSGSGAKGLSATNGKKKSALETALKNIFDDNIAESEEAERMRWWRLSHSLWRAFLVLFVTPFVAAQSVKSVIVNPWLGAHWGRMNASLTSQQRENVANGIQRFEQRVYYDRIIAGHKHVHTETTTREMLVEEARRLEDIERHKSYVATGNVIGSLIFITMTVTIVTLQKSNIARLLGEISDEFISLDAATQAFILMLGADMLVGYHSSDGWQAILATIITHYGIDFHKCEMAVRIFVAVVPVTLDIGFKYWVFNKLRKISPSTQIILGEIERH